ncbi:hypothetical protein [Maricaulis sp. W15]|uniref:hypothetical protein n=1 Tax=Maricaulis sp. W15 TaxID=1772333 RepID=UPI0011800515|nr:hypothetical protein [Maricaulis sp. W15]
MKYRASLVALIAPAILTVACSSITPSRKPTPPYAPPAPNLMVPAPLVAGISTPPEERQCSDYETAYVDMVNEYVLVSSRLLGLQRYARRVSGDSAED